MRKTLLTLTASAATVLAVAAPAAASPSDDTVVTFTIGTANLDITAPPAVNLGSTFAGTTLTGQIGPVTVNDQRAALTATWVATVSSTAFTTGSGLPEETVPPGVVHYWSGPALSQTGNGTVVPGQPTAAQEVPLNAPRVAFSKISGSGNNSVTWNPTLNIAIPDTAVSGTYQGVITHSVA